MAYPVYAFTRQQDGTDLSNALMRLDANDINQLQSAVEEIGRRSHGAAAIDLTSFVYDGDVYGMEEGIVEDQADVLMAAIAKGTAEGIRNLYLPEGDYWWSLVNKSTTTRILPVGWRLFGDGKGKTVVHALPSSFAIALPDEQGIATLLLFSSHCTFEDISFDGQQAAIRVLPDTANRMAHLIADRVTTATEDDGAEYVLLRRVEAYGQIANGTAGTISSANTSGSYQLTLAAGHTVEVGDEILVRGLTGATFELRDSDGTLLRSYSGNGTYVVLAISGNNLRIANGSDGLLPIVTVAGSGGFVDNTTNRNFEGCGVAFGHARYCILEDCDLHHNEGSGVFFTWRNRDWLDWGHTFLVLGGSFTYNGWQGIAPSGIRNLVVFNADCSYNDRNGMNSEHSTDVLYLGGKAEYNGKSGCRAAGDGGVIRFVDVANRYNGARDFAATFGPLPTPNDPDSTTAATAHNVNFMIQGATWSRSGAWLHGSPLRVEIRNCVSVTAEGRYDLRATVRANTNTPYSSLCEVVVDSPGCEHWRIQPDNLAAAEPDDAASVYVKMNPRWPTLRGVQRVAIPTLDDWSVVGSAARSTPASPWTTGLTSTAGTVTTITWTAHGFQTGARVILAGFTGMGSAKINRDEPWEITRTGANTFTIPVRSDTSGANGRGCDERLDGAGAWSNLVRTLTLNHVNGSGARITHPLTSLRGLWRGLRYKFIPASTWWTTGVTTTAGNPTVVNWTAHGFATNDTVLFEDMAGSDAVNINRRSGWRITVIDANSFSIPITTTGNTSGGRAAKADRLPVLDVGLKHVPGGGDPTNARFYPSLYHQITPADFYTWITPEIRAESRAALESIYQLILAVNTNGSTIDGHKLIVDTTGYWDSFVQMKPGAYDVPDVVSASIAYAGETLANAATGAQTDITIPGVAAGDRVLAHNSSVTGNGATVIIAQVHNETTGVVRLRLYNRSGTSQTYAAGTWYVTVIKRPRT